MMAFFRVRFALFRFEAKIIAVFLSLPFCFISLRSENDGSFSLLFSFYFCFVPFSFRFRFLRFASKRKKIRFRFASFCFEAKMTAHPNSEGSIGYFSTAAP
jgi:hypothetical protein